MSASTVNFSLCLRLNSRRTGLIKRRMLGRVCLGYYSRRTARFFRLASLGVRMTRNFYSPSLPGKPSAVSRLTSHPFHLTPIMASESQQSRDESNLSFFSLTPFSLLHSHSTFAPPALPPPVPPLSYSFRSRFPSSHSRSAPES